MLNKKENEKLSFLAKNLRFIRKGRNMTSRELADKLNITQSAVSKWENDLGEPTLSMAKRIAKELDTNLHYLVEIDMELEMTEKGALPPLPKIELGSGGDPQTPTPTPPPPQAQEQADYDRERIEKMIDEGLERGLEKVLGKIIMAGISASK